MLRTKEAALYLGISQKSLRRLVRLGKVEVIQNGNVWLFDVRELDRYIEGQQATAYPLASGTAGFDTIKGVYGKTN
jgi:excisionase family DNA binding protein